MMVGSAMDTAGDGASVCGECGRREEEGCMEADIKLLRALLPKTAGPQLRSS